MLQYYFEVKTKIHDAFGVSTPTQETIAYQLGLSTRTLQRRLADEGWKFSEILSVARHERALELLTDSDMTLEQISSYLGYTHVTGFYKSFKQRSGSTPNEIRNKLVNN